jgi:hypothetical protein
VQIAATPRARRSDNRRTAIQHRPIDARAFLHTPLALLPTCSKLAAKRASEIPPIPSGRSPIARPSLGDVARSSGAERGLYCGRVRAAATAITRTP